MAARDNFHDHALSSSRQLRLFIVVIGGIAIFWTDCFILLLRLIINVSVIRFQQLIQNVVMDTLLINVFIRKYQGNKFECNAFLSSTHNNAVYPCAHIDKKKRKRENKRKKKQKCVRFKIVGIMIFCNFCLVFS